jgi:hypothetical protein
VIEQLAQHIAHTQPGYAVSPVPTCSG